MAKIALICWCMTLNGCAAYTVVSAASWGVTGRGLADNGASVATGADCNAVRYAVQSQDYYCELPREAGSTYNRNGF